MNLHELHEELEEEKPDPYGAFTDNGSGSYSVVRLAQVKGVYFIPPNIPDEVQSIMCGNMGLMSLKGAPKIVHKRAYFSANHFKDLSGDLHQAEELQVSRCSLQSLSGDVRSVEYLIADKNNIKSLKGIHKSFDHIQILTMADNPLESHVLGLLLIDGLQDISLVPFGETGKLRRVEDILKKYLPNTRGRAAVLECQDELIEAGLDEYAQL